MLATAARTLATGKAPEGSISGEEMKAPIRQRLNRQVYRLVIYPEAQEQITALPDEALEDYAEVLGVLELAP